MKIILEYDPATGAVMDAAGVVIVNWVGINSFPSEESETTGSKRDSVDRLRDLQSQGYSLQEILELKQNGLLE